MPRCPKCGRVLPLACPTCPPQPFQCLCGKMVTLEPAPIDEHLELINARKKQVEQHE